MLERKEAKRSPIVVLLSNDIRHDLSAPMRSRCVYTYMPMPTAREEVAILCARVPETSAPAVAWVAKLLDCIRAIPGVQDKQSIPPGYAEISRIVHETGTPADRFRTPKELKPGKDPGVVSKASHVKDTNSKNMPSPLLQDEEFELEGRLCCALCEIVHCAIDAHWADCFCCIFSCTSCFPNISSSR
jgi:hypothetical protein